MAKIDYKKIFLKEAVPTSIGGQAVMDGIMMQGPDKKALAVRLPSGEILLRVDKKRPESKWSKVPFVRGCVSFFHSLIEGMKSLMDSADILESYTDDEIEEEPGAAEQWLEKKFGPKAVWNIMMGLSVAIAILATLLIFIVFPTVAVNWLRDYIGSNILLNLIEGILRIILFLLYIAAVRKVPDIKNTFRYHGAEHKTIHCYENGIELTPENVKHFYCLHPRCGTSFLMFVFIIALILFSFLGWPSLGFRIASRVILLPVIAGVSYELLRWAGRSDNVLVRILSYPGLMLQKLTTAEPSYAQIEVAIKALKAVIPENSEDIDFSRSDDADIEYTEVLDKRYMGQVSPAMAMDDEIAKEKYCKARGKRYGTDLATIENALLWGADMLSLVENGKNEARMIFSYITGLSRTDIIIKRNEVLPEALFNEYEKLIEERLVGKPLQYITKVQEFNGLMFKVNPSVLIPRLDTEILAEQVIGMIHGKGLEHPSVLDLCTGSGILGICIANEIKDAKVMLADVDVDAMNTAINNAQLNGVFERCSFVVGDMFSAIPDGRKYDVIVSNPPYIPTDEIKKLSTEVKDYEPIKALDGGADGLKFYRIIAAEAGKHLHKGGILALEIGCEQAEDVKALLKESGDFDKIAVIKDLAGLDRVLIGERS